MSRGHGEGPHLKSLVSDRNGYETATVSARSGAPTESSAGGATTLISGGANGSGLLG